MKVKYTGTSNYRELASRDFDKMGVDQNKLTFERDVPKEVSDEVGQALIEHALVAGEFEQVEEDEEKSESRKDSRQSSDDSEMTESGTAQESTGDTAGGTTGTAGRGSSAGRGTGGTRGSTTRTR